MENIDAIIFLRISMGITLSLILMFLYFMYFKLKSKSEMQLRILRFKLEDHPDLAQELEDGLQKICKEEGIKVFVVSREFINKDRELDDYVAGLYVYSTDKVQQEQRIKEFKELVEKTAYRQNISVSKLLNILGMKDRYEIELNYPRIMLSENTLKEFGLLSHYGTFLHELGHHFAVKELGSSHTEEDAERYGYNILKNNFPLVFQSIFYFHHKIRLESTGIEPIDFDQASEVFNKHFKIKSGFNFNQIIKLWRKNL